VGAGNNSSRDASAIISGAMIEDTLAASLTGSYRETNGFYSNGYTGQDDFVDFQQDRGGESPHGLDHQ